MSDLTEDEINSVSEAIDGTASKERDIQKEIEKAAENTGLPSKELKEISDVTVSLEMLLGRKSITIQEILSLKTRSLVELNELANEPVKIIGNGKEIAEGEIVVIGEHFGVRVTQITQSLTT